MIGVLWPAVLVLLFCVAGIPAALSVLFAGVAAVLAVFPAKALFSAVGGASVGALDYSASLIPLLLISGAALQYLGTVQTFPAARHADQERGAWYSGSMIGVPLPFAASLVLVCLLTETSIARSIVYGLVPGIVLTLAYLIILLVTGLRGGDLDLKRQDGSTSAALILSRIFVPLIVAFIAVSAISLGTLTPLEAFSVVTGAVAIFALFVAAFANGGWRSLGFGLFQGVQGFALYFLLMLGLILLSLAFRLGGGMPAVSAAIVSVGAAPGLLLALLCAITALIGIIVGPLAAVGLAVLIAFPAIASSGINPIQNVVALFLTAEAIRVGPRLGRFGGGCNPPTSWPHFIAALAITLVYAALPASLALPFDI